MNQNYFMNFNYNDTINLLIICATMVGIIKSIFSFIKFLIRRNDPPRPERTFSDELVREEKWYNEEDPEPYFKNLYKRTWNDGTVEYIETDSYNDNN